MDLPKGTFKGLAKVVAPVCLWMAAGWAAYPTVMDRLTREMGETVDIAEVRLFSMFMLAGCLIAGIALAVYGYIGTAASEEELGAMAQEPCLCPYCAAALSAEAKRCEKCGKSF
jgi:hypothetical protein